MDHWARLVHPGATTRCEGAAAGFLAGKKPVHTAGSHAKRRRTVHRPHAVRSQELSLGSVSTTQRVAPAKDAAVRRDHARVALAGEERDGVRQLRDGRGLAVRRLSAATELTVVTTAPTAHTAVPLEQSARKLVSRRNRSHAVEGGNGLGFAEVSRAFLGVPGRRAGEVSPDLK